MNATLDITLEHTSRDTTGVVNGSHRTYHEMSPLCGSTSVELFRCADGLERNCLKGDPGVPASNQTDRDGGLRVKENG